MLRVVLVVILLGTLLMPAKAQRVRNGLQLNKSWVLANEFTLQYQRQGDARYGWTGSLGVVYPRFSPIVRARWGRQPLDATGGVASVGMFAFLGELDKRDESLFFHHMEIYTKFYQFTDARYYGSRVGEAPRTMEDDQWVSDLRTGYRGVLRGQYTIGMQVPFFFIFLATVYAGGSVAAFVHNETIVQETWLNAGVVNADIPRNRVLVRPRLEVGARAGLGWGRKKRKK